MHNWNVSPQEAIQIQQELRKQVKLEKLTRTVEYIGGADISFDKGADIAYAAIVILKLPTLIPVSHATAVCPLTFPYVPGLLSFREIPILAEAWKKLKLKPDVIMLDGHGIAHPRRFGIASHFGVLFDIPAIGCAKKRLVGTIDEPGNEPGNNTSIYDGDERIGTTLRTKRNVKPVFISPGHKISFEESIAVTIKCLTKYRIPAPTRQAHILVNKLRREKLE